MANRFLSSRRKGFTLTEVAIVLGIVGIVLGAVWMAAGQVNEKSRVTQAMNGYNAVAQNMTSILQGGYGVSNPPCASNCNITQQMNNTKVIPTWLGAAGATTASTPWSNTGMVLSWISSNPRAYRMSFYNVPRDACIGMITQATNCTPGQPGCAVTVATKGTPPASGAFSSPGYCVALMTNGFSSTCTQNVNAALTSVQIEAACAQNTYPGGTGIANSVEFDFTQ